MTRRELFEHLETLYPASLSCDWDNDGAMLCSQWDKQVKKVVVCLDVTRECVALAIKEGADLIVSHHPFIFRPLSRIVSGDASSDHLLALLKHEIAVFSFHTRLDAAPGGLNDRLAQLLSLKEIRAVALPGESTPLARVGTISPCSPEAFAGQVARALGAPVKYYAGSGPVTTVMISCGGGRDFLPLARGEGADAFVSGDLHYNAALDANQASLTVIDAGHRSTELPVCALLKEKILELDGSLSVIECSLGGEEAWAQP